MVVFGVVKARTHDRNASERIILIDADCLSAVLATNVCGQCNQRRVQPRLSEAGLQLAASATPSIASAPGGFVADPCDRAGDGFVACVRVRLLKAFLGLNLLGKTTI